jgi:flagellar basal-body rod protein FlgF
MNGGIYTAYSGMRAQMEALDVAANNMANVNTAGFKEEKAFFTALDNAVNGSDTFGNNSLIQARSTLAVADGSPQLTNRDLDVALSGNGFLTVNGSQGNRYTRNGQLNINNKSTLCAGVLPIVGESGKPIVLGPGKVVINDSGDVYLDGTRVDRMKIVAFDDPSALIREGNSLFAVSKKGVEPKPSDAKVQQGYLEQSNVNAVGCVVGLVSIMRQFEAIQKSISLLMNEVNAKAIDKLSK